MNLYDYGDELAAKISAVQQMIEDGEEVECEAVQAALRDMVSAEGDLHAKAANVALYIRELKAQAEAVKAEQDRLAKRRASLVRRAESLTEYLLGALQQHGIEQVKTPLVTVSVRINPWSVEVADAKVLPPEYLTVKVEPNKKALLAARESAQFDGVTYQKSISLRIS